MNRFILFSSLFIVFSIVVSAQEGAPLLTHFSESRDVENQSWAICQDASKVMLFANRKGILSFDGEEWSSLKIPVIPFSMQLNPIDGRIFTGGENNYGYIEKQHSGPYRYVNLSGDSSNVGLISKILFSDSIIWFFGDKTISRYNLKTEKLELRLESEAGSPFSGMFIISGETYVNISHGGLNILRNDTLFPVINNRYPAIAKDILFSLPYDKDIELLAFTDGNMALFDGTRFYDYLIKDEGYLKDNIILDGICLSDSLYAFSTLGGGAVVTDRVSREVRYTINNQNGLPDDEIFAIGYDRSGGLWLSHQFGLTRADLNLPLGNFSIYPGLKGNLTNSLRYKGELYVATSEGVFYLARVNNYSQSEVLVKNKIESTQSNPVERHLSPMIVQPPDNTAELPSKKNIFSKIFGKKEVPAVTVETPMQIQVKQEPETAAISSTPLVKYTWKKVSRLKSVNYMYRKVEGLNEKCRQLVSTENGILAATNKGLFVIENHKAGYVTGNKYINIIAWQPSSAGKYLVGTDNGYFLTFFKNKKWRTEVPDPDFANPVYSLLQTADNTLWLGSENTAYRAEINNEAKNVSYTKFMVEVDYPQRYFVSSINDTIFLFTETCANYYDKGNDSFKKYTSATLADGEEGNIEMPLANIPVYRCGKKWKYMSLEKQIAEREILLFKLFDEIVSVSNEKDYLWIVDRENHLFGISRKKNTRPVSETTLLVKDIRNQEGLSFNLSDVVFKRGDNIINFKILAPVYLKHDLTQYQYFISRSMTDWSPWSAQTSYSAYIPKSGDYVLQIRAKDLWGNVGEPVSLNFTIKAPFTRTTLFWVLNVFIALAIIFLVVRFREKQLHEKNRILEEKVRERTAEIEAQKGEITSSIQYASRIQFAMLPVNDMFRDSFSDFFIIFKPRNIVSGDFYWIGEDERNIFLTVADCTGHGVPGAFMSALGISILNEIVTHNTDLQANTVLNLLREKIKRSLHQTGKDGEAADGMDISLCVFKKNRRSIQFSGAYNPLLIFTKGELREYKADRMPIGIHYGSESSFTNYEIPVRKGDVIYILSDGLTDQFGGPECTKFKKSNLRKLLAEIYSLPMSDQKKIIEAEFLRWKGTTEQVDDVTVLGVRI